MAPETCIDFDAANKSTGHVWGMFLGAFGTIFLFYKLVEWYDFSDRNPVSVRDYVMPFDGGIDWYGYHSSKVEKIKRNREKVLGIKNT